MSLFAEYKLEREDKITIEDNHGFAIYEISGDKCYIEDIYVKREHRKRGIAKHYADLITELARAHGCKFLFGSVSPQANGSNDSMLVLLAYGFTLHSVNNGLIFFVKGI